MTVCSTPHRLNSSVTSMWERRCSLFKRQPSFKEVPSVLCIQPCPDPLAHWCLLLQKRSVKLFELQDHDCLLCMAKMCCVRTYSMAETRLHIVVKGDKTFVYMCVCGNIVVMV